MVWAWICSFIKELFSIGEAFYKMIDITLYFTYDVNLIIKPTFNLKIVNFESRVKNLSS